MSRLTRDGTAELVSRDQILWRERGQGNIHFPCSADHEQDWQPYPVDPYSSCYMCDHTYIDACVNIAQGIMCSKLYTALMWSQKIHCCCLKTAAVVVCTAMFVM